MFKIDESALDIWSIPHFLSGVLIGIPALYFGYSFYESLAIVLVLSIGFEGIEIWFGIKESRANQVVDLILGIIAFVVGNYLFFTLSNESIRYMMIFSLFVYLLVVIPGWLRYLNK